MLPSPSLALKPPTKTQLHEAEQLPSKKELCQKCCILSRPSCLPGVTGVRKMATYLQARMTAILSMVDAMMGTRQLFNCQRPSMSFP